MDPATREFYQTRAEEWAAALPADRDDKLAAFLSRLPAGARILELGCGDGRDAAAMEARGFDVDATDGVEKMVELASARLTRPARLMLYEKLEAVGEYDGVWAHAALLHVPEDELPQILARLYRALKPGGWHFASYKGGNGGHRDQFGRFYSYIDEETLRASYNAAGDWSAFAMKSYQGGSFGKEPTLWHEVMAQKADG